MYSWAELCLVWELGRAYGQAEVADRLEELRALPPPHPLARTWEEQVAARRAELDHFYETQREAAASPPPDLREAA